MTKRTVLLLCVLVGLVCYVVVDWLRFPPFPEPFAPAPPSFPPTRLPGQPLFTASGHWYIETEASYFVPCRSEQRWWLWSEPSLRLEERRNALATPPANPPARNYADLFLRARFYRWPLGHYGHLGGYDRQILVTEVLDLRPATPTDCVRP